MNTLSEPIERACYLCGGNIFDIVMAGNYSFFLLDSKPVPFRAIRCRRCDFVMTDPPPSASYEDNSFVEDSDRLISSAHYRLRRLRPYLNSRTRILDIGCSTGYSLEEAARYGVQESVGVELCMASAEAGRRMGRDIRSIPLQECKFGDGQFDVVQAHHTLEHIPALRECLTEISHITKPGGIFYVTQPRYNSPIVRDSNWCGWFPQEHYWHFSEKTLIRLMAEYGFELVTYNCPLHSEYGTAKNWMYVPKRAYKTLVKVFRLGDMVDAIFVKRLT